MLIKQCDICGSQRGVESLSGALRDFIQDNLDTRVSETCQSCRTALQDALRATYSRLARAVTESH